MKEQAGEGAEAGGGLNASFNLQPVEEALNGLSVMADISVKAIGGTQDISGQALLGGDYVNHVFIFHGFGPRSINISLIAK